MRRCIKNYSKNISNTDIHKLQQYLIKYNKCKNIFYNKYYIDLHSIYLPYKFGIRDIIVNKITNGTLPINEMNLLNSVPAKLWKSALLETIYDLKKLWTLTFNIILTKINNNHNLCNRDKYYIRYILKSPNILYNIINNVPVTLNIDFTDINTIKLNKYIIRLIRKHMLRKPVATGHSYMLDGSSQITYIESDNSLFIKIPTLVKRQTLRIELTSKLVFSGDVRIVLKNDRVEFHKYIKLNEKINNNNKNIVLYIDGNNIFNTSSGITYGNFLLNIIGKYNEYFKNNNRYINRDEKYDVGYKKYNNLKNSVFAEIECYINKTINMFIYNETPSIVIMQDINKYLFISKHNIYDNIPINKLYMLNSWIIKTLKDRLTFKFSANGIKLILVNSSYTSKVCSKCLSFDTTISNGYFTCNNCTACMERTTNIINNIMDRFQNYSNIEIFTSSKEVKRLLEHQSMVTESTKTLP